MKLKHFLMSGVAVIAITFFALRYVMPNNVVVYEEQHEQDSPEMAAEQDAYMTVDPVTNTVPRERLAAANNMAMSYYNNPSSGMGGANPIPMLWAEVGPSNVGGRTRAVWQDLRTSKQIWAGGVSGGLWKISNLSLSTTWTKVNDAFENLAVTTIAQSTADKNYMYFGTGEGWFTPTPDSRMLMGGGIWRSVDGGTTWAVLGTTEVISSNTRFSHVQKIVVTPATVTSPKGIVFAATRRNGLMRSTDNGNNWTKVFPVGILEDDNITDNRISDVEVGSNGTIYMTCGFWKQLYPGAGSVYKSTDNGNTWTKLNNATNGFPNTGIMRIEIAVAPTDPNTIYATTSSSSHALNGIYKSINGGSTWTSCPIPTAAFNSGCNLTCQAFYNLTLAVSPASSSTVIMGSQDLFKSTDGGANWTQISDGYPEYSGSSIQYVHPDQHCITFVNSNLIYFANDGGVYRSTNGGTTIQSFNANYNITQFYGGAAHPTNPYILAGAQDNGTQKFTSFSYGATTSATAGDGAFCHIDQDLPSLQLTSYYGCTLNRSIDGGNTFSPILTGFYSNTGRFINPSDYDDVNNVFYAGYNPNEIMRVKNMGNITPSISPITNITLMNTCKASHIKVSPVTPTTIFIGTGGENGSLFTGRVLKVTNAASASPMVVNISGNNFPANAYVSCIEVDPINENHLLVTFSNYGVSSVFETTVGGGTTGWTNLDALGILPDIPIRWVIFNPLNSDQAILATESGIYSTTNLDGNNTIWLASSSPFPSTRVDMLLRRASDNMVFAFTYGRGMFKTNAFSGGKKDPLINQQAKYTAIAYPNPFKEYINIQFSTETKKTVKVEIFDLSGKVVARQNYTPTISTNHSIHFDLNDLPMGVYFYKVNDNESLVGKIIKQ